MSLAMAVELKKKRISNERTESTFLIDEKEIILFLLTIF